MKFSVEKLLIKPDMNLLVLNPPNRDLLGHPGTASNDHSPRLPTYDAIVIFAKDRAQMAASLDHAIERYKKGGLMWICYPKLSSPLAGDLSRNWLMTAIEGFRPVTNVAIDDDWTALRFRRFEEVGS